MTRPSTGSSNSTSSDNRGKNRGRARPDRQASNAQTGNAQTGNAIESSSIRRVDLPPQPGHSAMPIQVTPTAAEVASELESASSASTASTASGARQAGVGLSGDHRRDAIARAAYYRAEQRGFAPGYEVEDWLEAEREVLAKEGANQPG